MNKELKSRIGQLFTDNGISRLFPVTHVTNRPGCSVWQSRLYSNFGDADCQIHVYDFRNEPASIVDLEEEIASLADADHPQSIVAELRNEETGILVLCASEDAGIFEQYLEKRNEEYPLAYHPQLDRILGGDYFHQVEAAQNRWFKATICSMQRAMQLNDLLKEAETFYHQEADWPGKLEHPLPRILTVLQIEAIHVPGAPREYDDLALVQSVLNRVESVADPRVRPQVNVVHFARQVLGFLGTQHKHGLYYSRDGGCCFRPEFLSPDGSLTDAYFLNRKREVKGFHNAANTDVGNAMLVICELTQDPQLASEALQQGILLYLDTKTLSGEFLEIIGLTARELLHQNQSRLNALLNELLYFQKPPDQSFQT